MLKEKLESEGHEVEILEKTGFSLIDYLENRDEAVIVDSIRTGRHQVQKQLRVTEPIRARVSSRCQNTIQHQTWLGLCSGSGAVASLKASRLCSP
jgi:Ni,Fe-hydrogenase maturation factor